MTKMLTKTLKGLVRRQETDDIERADRVRLIRLEVEAERYRYILGKVRGASKGVMSDTSRQLCSGKTLEMSGNHGRLIYEA
jgi:hypothetical protein